MLSMNMMQRQEASEFRKIPKTSAFCLLAKAFKQKSRVKLHGRNQLSEDKF